jgi:hypothetical protein
MKKSKKNYWDKNWRNAGSGIKLTTKKELFLEKIGHSFRHYI